MPIFSANISPTPTVFMRSLSLHVGSTAESSSKERRLFNILEDAIKCDEPEAKVANEVEASSGATAAGNAKALTEAFFLIAAFLDVYVLALSVSLVARPALESA